MRAEITLSAHTISRLGEAEIMLLQTPELCLSKDANERSAKDANSIK